MGGGVGLIACCDIAVATAQRSSLTEVRLGLLPAVISPYVVSAIGERMARRYFLTAERIDAMEALRIGLVHAVVDDDEELDRTVATLAAELIKGGPRALAATKNLITTVCRGSIDRRMIEDTAGRIARLRVSTEGREGIAAFLDKRPPDWQKAK
jgi:methylglutaconyl-CoA hydratase